MALVEAQRVVLLGAGGVGKTSLLMRFLTGAYSSKHTRTVEDLYRCVFHLTEERTYHMEILDTAGSYQFPAMRQLSIRSGHAFIVVYALDDIDSLQFAVQLVHRIKEEKSEAPIYVCENKADTPEENRKVTSTEMSGCFSVEGIIHVEASAKNNTNVTDLFESIFKKVIKEEMLAPTVDERRKPNWKWLATCLKRALVSIVSDIPPRRYSDGDMNSDVGKQQKQQWEPEQGHQRLRAASLGAILGEGSHKAEASPGTAHWKPKPLNFLKVMTIKQRDTHKNGYSSSDGVGLYDKEALALQRRGSISIHEQKMLFGDARANITDAAKSQLEEQDYTAQVDEARTPPTERAFLSFPDGMDKDTKKAGHRSRSPSIPDDKKLPGFAEIGNENKSIRERSDQTKLYHYNDNVGAADLKIAQNFAKINREGMPLGRRRSTPTLSNQTLLRSTKRELFSRKSYPTQLIPIDKRSHALNSPDRRLLPEGSNKSEFIFLYDSTS